MELNLDDLPDAEITIIVNGKSHELATILLHRYFGPSWEEATEELAGDNRMDREWVPFFLQKIQDEWDIELDELQGWVLGSKVSKLFGTARKNSDGSQTPSDTTT